MSDEHTLGATRTKKKGAALSCAECRRLKLKCSRIFPCTNCVKKGCGAICPNDSLTTGKGNRFVLANTEDLHEKIQQLAQRVRTLEDALAESHAHNDPHNPHPLLANELLQIKRPLERERKAEPNPIPIDEDARGTTAAMGSLAITESGRSTFFGTTANSYYLLQDDNSDEEKPVVATTDNYFDSLFPPEVAWLQHAFPFAGQAPEDVKQHILAALPSVEEARRLSDLYYRHAAWMYTPIGETDFFDSIFRPAYYPPPVSPFDASPPPEPSAHEVAVLCMALATGALLDLDQPPFNSAANKWYQLGRAALSIDSVFDEPTIAAAQALVIMCHYMFLANKEGRWVVMGIVVKLTQSLGLHRDSGRWNLDPSEAQKRRTLLWEVFVYDSWQSLTFGRPPSFAMTHIDTKYPLDTVKNERGEVEMNFSAWKHRFCAECLSVIQDQAFGAHTPSYRTIQELDRKVRTFYVPPSLLVPGFGGVQLSAGAAQPSMQLTMQRYIAFAIREITIFYLHRGFFATALEENPVDPMASKYAASVLAAYNSAQSFVGLVTSLHKQHPRLTERMFFLFSHVFSCAIVLGSIAMRGPRIRIARSAQANLNAAYTLFLAVQHIPRSGKVLPILLKLKDRAHAAMGDANPPFSPTAPEHYQPVHHSSHSHSGAFVQSPESSTSTVKTEEDVDEQISALGGRSRLVARKASSNPSSPSHTNGGSASPQSMHGAPPSMLGTSPIQHTKPMQHASPPQHTSPMQHTSAMPSASPRYNTSPLQGSSSLQSFPAPQQTWPPYSPEYTGAQALPSTHLQQQRQRDPYRKPSDPYVQQTNSYPQQQQPMDYMPQGLGSQTQGDFSMPGTRYSKDYPAHAFGAGYGGGAAQPVNSAPVQYDGGQGQYGNEVLYGAEAYGGAGSDAYGGQFMTLDAMPQYYGYHSMPVDSTMGAEFSVPAGPELDSSWQTLLSQVQGK
ncbi:fungal-specific transcription factor domain-containing protein [Schizophyllum fasciatum]